MKHDGPISEAQAILLVEDAPELQGVMRRYLERCGYRVTVAGSVAEMQEKWGASLPDLVLCDINLPDGDSREAARRLRIHDHAALIFVTACDEVSDRIQALDDGGDDYVVKPVVLDELAARVRSVLRRRGSRSSFLMVGNWRLDLVRKQLVSPGGEQAVMTGGEFSLLMAMAVSVGNVVSRDVLLEAIGRRDDRDVTVRTVDTLITRLRRKIPPASTARDLPRPVIRTVRRSGYRLDLV